MVRSGIPIFLFIALVTISVFPELLFAFHEEGHLLQLEYPTIDIPGFEPTTLRLDIGLNLFLAWLYYFIVSIAGLVAFLMLVWGGFGYLTSAGNPGKIGEAKDRMTSAIVGLIIIFTSFIILQTINPDLVILSLP